MPRLPAVGGDAGNWGIILNEFLSVSLKSDGTLRNSAFVINVKDFGAKGDGNTDDTRAIQGALDSVPPLGGTVFFPAGIYMTSTLLIKQNNTNIAGNQATLRSITSMIRVLSTNDFHDCIIDGLIVIGTGADTGTSSGRGAIHISNLSERCIIKNNKILNASGSGIVDDGIESKTLNNYIEVTGEHGIYMSSSTQGVVSGNTIKRAGVISVLAPPLSGIKVDGASLCTLYGNIIVGSQSQGITLTNPAFQNTIIGNVIRNSRENDVYFGTGNDNIFSNNIVDSSASGFDAILIVGGTRNIIQGNHIRKSSSGGSGIRWNTVGALGWDICEGNMIIGDGSFTMPAGIHIDAAAQFIQVRNNYIQAINSCRISHGVLIDGAFDTTTIGNMSNASSKITDNGTRTSTDYSIPAISESSPPKLLSGSGSPEGVVTAPVGSIYVRNNGGSSSTLYIKESGIGNTGWVSK